MMLAESILSATTLPEPDVGALAHSECVVAHIRAQIAAAGGAIPFARWMELALYAPGLGYYSAGARKFGAAGDFVTAPELGPLFAECVAEAIAPVLRALGGEAQFLEIGGGSGAFAEAALRTFAGLDCLPARYAILEPSADLRERQRERLEAKLPEALAARVAWLDGPPQTPWRGALFANEVLDCLPATRFAVRGGEVYEQYVALDPQDRFIVVDQPADALVAASVRHVERYMRDRGGRDRGGGASFTDGYRSEILPQLPYWVQAVGGLLRDGVMLFVDYGYPRCEYYLPERRDGTLVCHYRHRAHADPFHLPGLQDLTAFVDFTALAEAGVHAGFDLAGYCAQASFLLNGLAARAAGFQALTDDVERYRRANEIKRLTLPGEMGERFQAMGFARGVDFAGPFAAGSLVRRL